VRASEHTPVDVAVADTDDDRDTEGARDGLILVEGDRESVTSVVRVRDTLRLAVSDRESVGSIDLLAVTLLDTEVDAVSEAVKLGDTGDFVTEGVIDGEGMITVYDMKNTDPEPRLIMLAPIWDPPAFQKVASEIPVCSVVPTAVPEKSM
jgi:hypothetical protein